MDKLVDFGYLWFREAYENPEVFVVDLPASEMSDILTRNLSTSSHQKFTQELGKNCFYYGKPRVENGCWSGQHSRPYTIRYTKRALH